MNGFDTIEPTPAAEEDWRVHCTDCADITLFQDTNSWYMGANVPGKPRVLFPYIGGVGRYRRICTEAQERGFLGFELHGNGKHQLNPGPVRLMQPDVEMMLDVMATLELPPIEAMSPAEARGFMDASATMRAPGPDVGEIVDGTFPGAAGDLEYRIYRPASAGPHPIVVYYHGGGWVLGSHTSDDPLCRDLCKRADVIIISVNCRHAPEARFPAAVDDAWAALKWVADNAEQLGGDANRIAVAGWSAGGNLAAVVAQMARDNAGPALRGQLLLTPVTDGSRQSASYTENGEGYVLTKNVMEWFWSHYASAEGIAIARRESRGSATCDDRDGSVRPTA